jgi:hypothetical protein
MTGSVAHSAGTACEFTQRLINRGIQTEREDRCCTQLGTFYSKSDQCIVLKNINRWWKMLMKSVTRMLPTIDHGVVINNSSSKMCFNTHLNNLLGYGRKQVLMPFACTDMRCLRTKWHYRECKYGTSVRTPGNPARCKVACGHTGITACSVCEIWDSHIGEHCECNLLGCATM